MCRGKSQPTYICVACMIQIITAVMCDIKHLDAVFVLQDQHHNVIVLQIMFIMFINEIPK